MFAVDLLGHRTLVSDRRFKRMTSVVERDDGWVVGTKGCPLRLDTAGLVMPGPVLCVEGVKVAFDGSDLVEVVGNFSRLEILRFSTETGLITRAERADLPWPSDNNTTALIARNPELRTKVKQAMQLPGVSPTVFQVSQDARWLFVNGDLFSPGAIVNLEKKALRTGLKPLVASGNGSVYVQERDETTLEVHAVSDGRLVRTVTVEHSLDLWLSHDGKLMAVEGDGTLVIIDLTTGKTVASPPCRAAYHSGLVFSRDGKRLLCDSGEAALVFDIAKRTVLHKFPHHFESVDSFDLSADGRQVAIAVNETIELYDLTKKAQ